MVDFFFCFTYRFDGRLRRQHVGWPANGHWKWATGIDLLIDFFILQPHCVFRLQNIQIRYPERSAISLLFHSFPPLPSIRQSNSVQLVDLGGSMNVHLIEIKIHSNNLGRICAECPPRSCRNRIFFPDEQQVSFTASAQVENARRTDNFQRLTEHIRLPPSFWSVNFISLVWRCQVSPSLATSGRICLFLPISFINSIKSKTKCHLKKMWTAVTCCNPPKLPSSGRFLPIRSRSNQRAHKIDFNFLLVFILLPRCVDRVWSVARDRVQFDTEVNGTGDTGDTYKSWDSRPNRSLNGEISLISWADVTFNSIKS